MSVHKIRNRLLFSILLGVLVYAALTAFSDFEEVANSFGDFRWELLPLILLVTCGNYGLRFVKWQYYLRAIGVTGLRFSDSFLIYFSGLGMVVTPGKVGEWLKSYLLREVHGTPVMRSAPILLAERLTDSLALLVIGGVGVIFKDDERPALHVLALDGAGRQVGQAWTWLKARHIARGQRRPGRTGCGRRGQAAEGHPRGGDKPQLNGSICQFGPRHID